MADVPGGTVLRGEDGSLYFIRDELLEACKVEGEYKDRLESVLSDQANEVEGFALNFSSTAFQSNSLTRLSSPALSQQIGGGALDLGKVKDIGNSMSTVMCPW